MATLRPAARGGRRRSRARPVRGVGEGERAGLDRTCEPAACAIEMNPARPSAATGPTGPPSQVIERASRLALLRVVCDQAFQPPSTVRFSPLIKDASGLAR